MASAWLYVEMMDIKCSFWNQALIILQSFATLASQVVVFFVKLNQQNLASIQKRQSYNATEVSPLRPKVDDNATARHEGCILSLSFMSEKQNETRFNYAQSQFQEVQIHT